MVRGACYSEPMIPVVRAPRGRTLRARGWRQEAALRMLMNNLDPEVAENPDELVVYGGQGRAARNSACFLMRRGIFAPPVRDSCL